LERLLAEHGDAKLTDLLVTLAGLAQGALDQHPRPLRGDVFGPASRERLMCNL
jgi:hypothetical protein